MASRHCGEVIRKWQCILQIPEGIGITSLPLSKAHLLLNSWTIWLKDLLCSFVSCSRILTEASCHLGTCPTLLCWIHTDAKVQALWKALNAHEEVIWGSPWKQGCWSQIACLCHLPALCPWPSYLTSLCLSFLISRMNLLIASISYCYCEDEMSQSMHSS